MFEFQGQDFKAAKRDLDFSVFDGKLGDLVFKHIADEAGFRGEAHGELCFCTDILRENAYRLDIPGDFRVAEEEECAELQEQVLQQLLEECYANSTSYALAMVSGNVLPSHTILFLEIYI